MKRFYVILLFSLFIITYVCGQEIKKHVVQRGETLESIAKNYNLSPTELRNANNDMEIFYTGLEINVPIKIHTVLSNGTEQSTNSDEQILKTLTAYLNDCEIADNLFETRNYSKAQKQYQQIIRKYNGVLSCNEALYGNALCSYNREKWKSAIKDLSIVINNEHSSQKERDHCKKLLVKAQSYRDQQLENRSNLWGGLFMTAATVGTAYMATKANADTNPGVYTSNTTASSSFGYGTSALNRNYAAELNVLSNQTIAQGQAEEEREYQNFKSQFKKADGSDYTKNEWRAMKGEAYVQMKNEGNSSSGTTQNNNTTTSSAKKCTTCNGTGRMPYDTFPEQYGFDNSYKVKCNECGKSFPKSWGHTHTTCTSCHGKGYYGL